MSNKSECCHHAQSQKPVIKAEEGALYTCPMHPEIVRSAPGPCPKCGMALEPMTISLNDAPNEELIDMRKRFWGSLIFTIPLLMLTMGEMIPGLQNLLAHIPMTINGWLQCLLAIPVVFWFGWPILSRAIFSLRQRSLNMFTLIALGTIIAFVYSLIVLIYPQLLPSTFKTGAGASFLYFESAAVIITLVLLGQVLELRGREGTGEALRSLLDLAPKRARKIGKNGTESDVLASELEQGDMLRIKPGEKIPVDGIITEGHGVLDESMVTGESIPVEKVEGDKVIGGTLNSNGSFIMRAEQVGGDTMLSQMVLQVAQAQRSKAPIQRIADMVAGYFVPAVVIASIITLILWIMLASSAGFTYGMISAISVLIIACPCALGLATPMSIMVGMGRGAHAGILIKDAASLERFEKVTTIVVDKTGTLTQGKPVVSQVIAAGNQDKNQLIRLAASLENQSEHPLAQAFIQYAKENNLELQQAADVKVEVGQGIQGQIDQEQVALGNAAMMKSLSINIDTWQEKADQLRQDGGTVVFLVLNNEIAGLIEIKDMIKPTTLSAIKQLHDAGKDIVMLTGDHPVTAEAIGKQLGIKQIKSNVSPLEKSAVIKELRASGKVVAMAGDGVNDAAALAEADVGIAMGTGADIAMQSADVTLVKGDLAGISRALMLSHKVMSNIRQNLFLAFFYNAMCIPLAAGVLYPFTGWVLNPMIAAAAMSLSSVSVIVNASRLRGLKFE